MAFIAFGICGAFFGAWLFQRNRNEADKIIGAFVLICYGGGVVAIITRLLIHRA